MIAIYALFCSKSVAGAGHIFWREINEYLCEYWGELKQMTANDTEINFFAF